MDFASFATIAAAYGPSGIIVAWFAWRDWRRDVRDREREIARGTLEEKRISADLALASGYAILATKLDSLSNVRRD